MNLSTRLTVAMVALVLFTASAVGFLINRNIETRALPRALDRLDTHASLLAVELEASVRPAVADVLTQGGALNGLIRARLANGVKAADGLSESEWRGRLASRFAAELTAKPIYSRFRLIGVADGGREIVHVDRLGPGGSIRVVPESDLHQLGDRDFFKAALNIPLGQVYAAPIDFARENAALELPHVPTLRVAAPVHTPDGQLFGVMVVNIDMRSAFAALRSGGRENETVYLVDDRGDYLVHPDQSQEFGWLLGRPTRIQDELPSFGDLLGDKDTVPRVLQDGAGAKFGVGWESVNLAGGPSVTVIETVPYARILAAGSTVPSVLGALLALFAALPLAVWFARSLSRPLAQMTKAIEGFAKGETLSIPINAKGEIGVLAQAFSRMATEMDKKTSSLQREVDEHQRAQSKIRELAERERLFVAAVESSNDAIVTKDLNAVITGWNPAAERLFGYTGQEAIGKSIDIIVPSELRGEVREILGKIKEGEKVDHHETVRIHRNGGRIDVSLSVSPIRSQLGAIIGAAKVVRDLGARKKAQEALRDSEQMAQAIIDTALDAFLQLDDTGTTIGWSPKAEEMFGWSTEEVVGRKLSDFLIPAENREAYSGRIAQFLRDAEKGILGRRYESPSLRRDGTRIKTEVSLAALRRRDGYIINCFIRDITEKVAAEEQLKEAQKMESVGQLTGGIAHDFNNMLTVITGTIDILGDAVSDKPQLAAIAKLISEAADRGAELTSHLLAFARKQPLQPREIDINALMTSSGKLIRPALGEHIEIKTSLRPDVWSALVDPNQLSSALLNLAINSRDAMPNGGRLTLETDNVVLDQSYVRTNAGVAVGEYVLIAVSDTGQGIPEAIRKKIFEPFFTTKDVGMGTGLGLSMVYGFVKQSGGHIKVYSEEGHGTTFRIYLPRADAQAEPIVSTLDDRQIDGGNETILIVEDDALVRDSVTAQICGLGYKTLSAANAAEALAIADRGAPFDLLFTDVIMPGKMNGRQLAEEMARRRSPLKVLFTSGYTENALIHHGRLDPGVLLLAKPYRKAELARMIRRALDAVDDLPAGSAIDQNLRRSNVPMGR